MIMAYEAMKTERISIKRGALHYRVPDHTLRDRVKGKIDPHNLQLGSETIHQRGGTDLD